MQLSRVGRLSAEDGKKVVAGMTTIEEVLSLTPDPREQ